MDEIIAELKQKRVMIQQKDALIAELNEQVATPPEGQITRPL